MEQKEEEDKQGWCDDLEWALACSLCDNFSSDLIGVFCARSTERKWKLSRTLAASGSKQTRLSLWKQRHFSDYDSLAPHFFNVNLKIDLRDLRKLWDWLSRSLKIAESKECQHSTWHEQQATSVESLLLKFARLNAVSTHLSSHTKQKQTTMSERWKIFLFSSLSCAVLLLIVSRVHRRTCAMSYH